MVNRRAFFKKTGALTLGTILASGTAYAGEMSSNAAKVENREYYEWRHYMLKDGAGPKMDAFFENVLIPAYNRQGVKVGAYKMFKEDEPERRVLLFVHKDLQAFQRIKHTLWEDKVFAAKAKSFFEESASNPFYTNVQTYLCEAFSGFPKLVMPDPSRTLMELRTYWSPNEEAHERKVEMFNKYEFKVFEDVGVNSVCYGSVMAGPSMHALVYMTWYKDMDTRNAVWAGFRDNPGWLAIKDLPRYANTVKKNTIEWLAPLSYSQV